MVPRALSASIAGVALLVLVAGCPQPVPDNGPKCVKPGTGADAPPDATQPFVWIGTNGTNGAYQAIAPNAALVLQHGPQGGTHVWGAARLFVPKAGSWALQFHLSSGGMDVANDEEFLQGCPGEIAEITSVRVQFVDIPMGAVQGVLSVDAAPNDGGAPTVHAEVPITVQ